MDIVTVLESMGFISRTVVVVLALMSVYSLYVTVERTLTFRRAGMQSLGYLRVAADHLQHSRSQAAIEAARTYPASHLARVVAAGLATFEAKSRKARLTEEEVVEAASRALERSVLLTTAELKRGLTGLATVATLAPFIGLFGTVAGIIKAFHTIGVEGAAGFAVVSVGISEALVATAIGIGVAIPAAWMYNRLGHRLERLQVEMTNSASELIDFFLEERRRAA